MPVHESLSPKGAGPCQLRPIGRACNIDVHVYSDFLGIVEVRRMKRTIHPLLLLAVTILGALWHEVQPAQSPFRTDEPAPPRARCLAARKWRQCLLTYSTRTDLHVSNQNSRKACRALLVSSTHARVCGPANHWRYVGRDHRGGQ